MPKVLADILYVLLGFILGCITGFFILKRVMQKNFLGENGLNEDMIRSMMSAMGRSPSQKQVNQVLREVNKHNQGKKKK